jgi:hypothetical protein
MKILKKHRSKFIALMVFAAACSSASLNGDSLVQVEVTADPGITVIGNGLMADTIEFSLAKTVLTDIEFRSASNCASGDEGQISYQGPFVVNLLNRKAVPSLDEVQLKKGNYCRLKFKLDKLNHGDVPSGIDSNDEIVDLSVLVKGKINTIPFVLKLDENQDYELRATDSTGFQLAPDTSNTLFLVFNLSKLFDGIDSSTLDHSSGTILIDKDNNQDAFDIAKSNLEKFSALQKDSNEDGKLNNDDDVIADVKKRTRSQKKAKLPPTSERIARTTPDKMNARIRRHTVEKLDIIGEDEARIDTRLEELNREWDFERCLLLIAAFANSMSLTTGFFIDRRGFIVTALVGLFLLIHALHGWAPPLPILRRFGVRTAREIENERFILKTRKGDFQHVPRSSDEFMKKVEK